MTLSIAAFIAAYVYQFRHTNIWLSVDSPDSLELFGLALNIKCGLQHHPNAPFYPLVPNLGFKPKTY